MRWQRNSRHQLSSRRTNSHTYTHSRRDSVDLDVDGWHSMTSMGGWACALAVANETAVNLFSFSGQMCVISKNSNCEDHQGSGNLGPSFVGVVSVREGRGLLQLSRQAVLGKMAT